MKSKILLLYLLLTSLNFAKENSVTPYPDTFIETFLNYVKREQLDSAATYVWPSDINDFMAVASEASKYLPDTIQTEIILKSDTTADCNILNSNAIGFDLLYHNDRWWIVTNH